MKRFAATAALIATPLLGTAAVVTTTAGPAAATVKTCMFHHATNC